MAVFLTAAGFQECLTLLLIEGRVKALDAVNQLVVGLGNGEGGLVQGIIEAPFAVIGFQVRCVDEAGSIRQHKVADPAGIVRQGDIRGDNQILNIRVGGGRNDPLIHRNILSCGLGFEVITVQHHPVAAKFCFQRIQELGMLQVIGLCAVVIAEGGSVQGDVAILGDAKILANICLDRRLLLLAHKEHIVALVLMFIGGAGKSAMFPLHIWLPDAMEGPTPVSALIHAATMVVAGVFQIARLFPLWIEYAGGHMSIVVWVGVFTAFYAAAVACAQTDIKRVLAFSTISQIAFMMVALGVCLPGHDGHIIDHHGSLGYMASMFHLFTHAMFKACLFLGAGCIIHAVHSNEMSAMGGLRKYMPITHATFLISCLAIAGIPFFSGFSSKDEIITACFAYSPVVGWIMTGVAAMTAFYMFRLYYGIFWGTENKELHAHHTPHEGPWTMTFPLIFLCLITVGVGIYTTLGGFLNWGGSFGSFVTANGTDYTIHFDLQIALTSTIIAIIGICLATYIYKNDEQPIADKLYKTFPRLHRAAYKRFYMDEVYQYVTHKIIFRCISTPIAWFDRHIIDGTFDFIAWGSNEAGDSIRPWQSGDVRHYAVWFITGAIALTLVLLAI